MKVKIAILLFLIQFLCVFGLTEFSVKIEEADTILGFDIGSTNTFMMDTKNIYYFPNTVFQNYQNLSSEITVTNYHKFSIPAGYGTPVFLKQFNDLYAYVKTTTSFVGVDIEYNGTVVSTVLSTSPLPYYKSQVQMAYSTFNYYIFSSQGIVTVLGYNNAPYATLVYPGGDLVVDNGNNIFVFLNSNNSIQVLNINTYTILSSVSISSGIDRQMVLYTGTLIVVCGYQQSTSQLVIETYTNTYVQTLYSIADSPDGQCLSLSRNSVTGDILVSTDQGLYIIDPSFQQFTSVTGDSSVVASVFYTPTNQLPLGAYASSSSNTINFFSYTQSCGCSENGNCISGTCTCFPGYLGATCDIPFYITQIIPTVPYTQSPISSIIITVIGYDFVQTSVTTAMMPTASLTGSVETINSTTLVITFPISTPIPSSIDGTYFIVIGAAFMIAPVYIIPHIESVTAASNGSIVVTGTYLDMPNNGIQIQGETLPLISTSSTTLIFDGTSLGTGFYNFQINLFNNLATSMSFNVVPVLTNPLNNNLLFSESTVTLTGFYFSSAQIFVLAAGDNILSTPTAPSPTGQEIVFTLPSVWITVPYISVQITYNSPSDPVYFALLKPEVTNFTQQNDKLVFQSNNLGMNSSLINVAMSGFASKDFNGDGEFVVTLSSDATYGVVEVSLSGYPLDLKFPFNPQSYIADWNTTIPVYGGKLTVTGSFFTDSQFGFPFASNDSELTVTFDCDITAESAICDVPSGSAGRVKINSYHPIKYISSISQTASLTNSIFSIDYMLPTIDSVTPSSAQVGKTVTNYTIGCSYCADINSSITIYGVNCTILSFDEENSEFTCHLDSEISGNPTNKNVVLTIAGVSVPSNDLFSVNYMSCPDNCSNNGVCDITTGKCSCTTPSTELNCYTSEISTGLKLNSINIFGLILILCLSVFI